MDLSPFIEKNSDNFKLFSAIPEGTGISTVNFRSKTLCFTLFVYKISHTTGIA
jgi:hypothetical protein